MTLNDLFELLSTHPGYTLGYLVFVPVMSGLLGILADERASLNPWRYFYTILLYMICIPGMFVITLLAYTFLFEQTSIYGIDIITHVLPVISMIISIMVIRRQVELDSLPGFGKLTGLILMITVALIILWVLQKTRIILFTYLPFQYVILILAGLLLLFRIGLKKVF